MCTREAPTWSPQRVSRARSTRLGLGAPALGDAEDLAQVLHGGVRLEGQRVRLGHPDLAGVDVGLRRWDGHGAVRLLRADPARGALLLERLTTEDLTEVWDEQAREVVNAMWSIEAGGPEARDRVSLALALVKAVDD